MTTLGVSRKNIKMPRTSRLLSCEINKNRILGISGIEIKIYRKFSFEQILPYVKEKLKNAKTSITMLN